MINDLAIGILSAIIRDGSRLSEVELNPSDFQHDTHKEVFTAILELQSANQPIDVLTISDLLNQRTGKNWLKAVGGIAKAGMENHIVGNISHHAEQLTSHIKAARIVEIAAEIMAKANSGSTDIETQLGELMKINVPDTKNDWTIQDCMSNAINSLDEVLGRDGVLVGTPTGISDLDAAIGGFQKSDLYVIGARPAMGKTSLLLNMAYSGNVPCGIISTEQGNAQLGLRFISLSNSVSAQKLRNADLSESEFTRITGAVSKMTSRQIFINDKSLMTISEVVRQTRKWVFDYGIKIIYIDYIQRIRADDLRQPKHLQVEEVVVGLKTMAKELDIAVVALAQVSRKVEDRTDKRPYMSDLKDSGSIEQEADNVMMLYRDSVYNEEANPADAEINVIKNRHGPTGTIFCRFEREFMRFEDRGNEYD